MLNEVTYDDLYLKPDTRGLTNLYTDFKNNRPRGNIDCIYVRDNTLMKGEIVYQDHIYGSYTLKDFPHIKTIKGELIPSNGSNFIIY